MHYTEKFPGVLADKSNSVYTNCRLTYDRHNICFYYKRYNMQLQFTIGIFDKYVQDVIE